MTIKEFQKNPLNRTRLAEVLADPVMQIALMVAKESFDAKIDANTDTSQVLTISRYHQQAGANKFLTVLKALTDEPKQERPLVGRKLATSLEDLPPQ